MWGIPTLVREKLRRWHGKQEKHGAQRISKNTPHVKRSREEQEEKRETVIDFVNDNVFKNTSDKVRKQQSRRR